MTGGTARGDDPLASAQAYDPQGGVWSATQGLLAARSSHTATLLPDGTVLVAGGMGSADTSASGLHEPLASAEAQRSGPANVDRNSQHHLRAPRTLRNVAARRQVLVAGGMGYTPLLGSVDLASAQK